MSEYTKVDLGKPGIRYRKDGILIKKSEIPPQILMQLDVGMNNLNDVEPEKEPLSCIFCGMGTKITRFLNQETIALCSDHYYSETTGRVVQKFNELYRKEDSRENETTGTGDSESTGPEGNDGKLREDSGSEG